MKMRVSKYESEGTCSQYYELTEEFWHTVFGKDWNKLPHKVLDFSSDAFVFSSLKASNGGILNSQLNLKHLKELNLHNNCLTEVENVFISTAPFSHSLQTLILSKNFLTSPTIDLPYLEHLDLSNNQLSTYPTLNYVPELKILKLANNRISTLWECIEKCPKLTHFDISNNIISIYPSQLEWALFYFSKCPKLLSISVAGNPFANWFPEHATFLLSNLPQLEFLNEIDFRNNKIRDTYYFPVTELANYDLMYEERRVQNQLMESVERPEDVIIPLSIEKIPSLKSLLLKFDKALLTVDNAVHFCSHISRVSDMIYKSTTQDFSNLFLCDNVKKNIRQKSQLEEETIPQLISTFIQNIIVLIERYDAVRPNLLLSLVKFGCVPDYGFGNICLSAFNDYITNNEAFYKIGTDAIANFCIPCIRGKSYTESICKSMIQGLSRMRTIRTLGEILQPCTTDIISFLEDNPTDVALIALLSMLVDFHPNAVECFGQGVPCFVGNAFFDFEKNKIGVKEFVDYLHIGSRCASSMPKAANYFVSHEFHTKYILSDLKEKFREKETYKWPLEKATLTSAMIDFLTGIIQDNEQGMADCVDRFHVTDLLLIPVKEDIADVLILTSSCQALLVIMKNTGRQNNLLEYITEQANRFQPLFQYLNGRLYKDLCIRAEQHMTQKQTLYADFLVPDIKTNVNKFVHAAFSAIISILFFFLQNNATPYCAIVNEYLSQKKREKYLFKLLLSPNIMTRYWIVQCLIYIPIQSFTEKNVSTLLSFLKTFQNFTSEEAASIIACVLIVLQRFIDDVEGKSGQLLRRTHLEKTFDVLYELLYRATALRTNTKESFKIKSKICVASCNFLRGASYHMDLRSCMRKNDHIRHFHSILKAEENTCTSYSKDVAVERCWTGRDVSVLIGCFINSDRLTPGRRVAFRVMSQLADVLEGRSGLLDMANDIVIQNLVKREEAHFNERLIRRQVAMMDDLEWKDWLQQQQSFIRLRGPEHILGFMAPLAPDDFSIRIAQERKENKHSEYWAGRFKALCEDAEINKEFDEELGLSNKFEFYAADAQVQDTMRFTLFQALNRTAYDPDARVYDLYFRYNTGFYEANSLWSNAVLGELRTAVTLAALFRCFYACLVLPVNHSISFEIKRFLRQPVTIRKLISLLECVPLLDCCVGSKFLLLYQLVLRLEPSQAAESMDLIIPYDILSRVIQQLIHPLQWILRKGNVYPLELKEQIFLTELASLTSVIVRQTSWIKFSNYARVQQWAIQYALARYIGKDASFVVSLYVNMIMYDLLVSSGSARGTFIEHLLEKTADSREDMRVACIQILSEIIQRSAFLKYETLELLIQLQVFKKVLVRKTFFFEVLESANMGHYTQALQQHLSKRQMRAERVLQCFVAHVSNTSMSSFEFSQRVICLTNYGFYCIQKPIGIRNFSATASHTSYHNIQQPVISREDDFSNITRLVRGYPLTQVLILCWKNSNLPSTGFSETYEILICDVVSTTYPVLQCLHSLIGTALGKPVPVIKDSVFLYCLKFHVPVCDILTASYVYREQDDKTLKLVFHVLTNEAFFEFEVKWDYWFALPPERMQKLSGHSLGDSSTSQDDGLEDDKNENDEAQELDNFLGFIQQNDTDIQKYSNLSIAKAPIKLTEADGVLNALPHFEQYTSPNKTSVAFNASEFRKKLEVSKANLLHLVFVYQLDKIKAVAFSSNEEPRITYTFDIQTSPRSGKLLDGNKMENSTADTNSTRITVIYLDDLTRERWKRYFANALNKLETSSHWRRGWKYLIK